MDDTIPAKPPKPTPPAPNPRLPHRAPSANASQSSAQAQDSQRNREQTVCAFPRAVHDYSHAPVSLGAPDHPNTRNLWPSAKLRLGVQESRRPNLSAS